MHLTGGEVSRPPVSAGQRQALSLHLSHPLGWGGFTDPLRIFAFEIRNASIVSFKISFFEIYRVFYVVLMFLFSFVFLRFNRLLMVSGFLSFIGSGCRTDVGEGCNAKGLARPVGVRMPGGKTPAVSALCSLRRQYP